MMQQAFVHEFETNPNFVDSGTTWTSAYLVSSFAILAQIGDSPTFLWRDGTFQRITTDHTIEQEFIAAGVEPEIAGKYSHMLTRCLRYDATQGSARRVSRPAPPGRPAAAVHRRIDGHGRRERDRRVRRRRAERPGGVRHSDLGWRSTPAEGTT